MLCVQEEEEESLMAEEELVAVPVAAALNTTVTIETDQVSPLRQILYLSC